jgi:hypothetical protein
MGQDLEGRALDGEGRSARRVRLPGFVGDDGIGLGELAERITHALGVTPCGGCQKRARRLDRWITVSGRRSRR